MRIVKISILLIALAAIAIFAAVPKNISYQGRLTNASGVPITGTHNITFKIYNVESGGTALWTETQSITLNSEGLYNAMLGIVTPFTIDFDVPYWLGIAVDGGSEICRYKLGASPYAINLVDTLHKDYSSHAAVTIINENTGYGIIGESYSTQSNFGGVTGKAKSDGGSAIYGETWSLGKPAPGAGSSIAVFGWAPNTGASVGGAALGVLGRVNSYQGGGASVPTGIFGEAMDTTTTGAAWAINGDCYSRNIGSAGVKGTLMKSNAQGRAIWGDASHTGGTGYAGYFEGNVNITGNLTVSGSYPGGGGSGTVTSISQGTGITCSPNPITITGTVSFNTTWGDSRYLTATNDYGRSGVASDLYEGTTTLSDKYFHWDSNESESGMGLQLHSYDHYGIVGITDNTLQYAGVFGRVGGSGPSGALGHRQWGVYGNSGTGTYAGYFEGNVAITGKLDLTGTLDPPCVLFDRETRDAIKTRVAKEVPIEKQSGAVLFWNGENKRFEIYLPADGEFLDLQGNILLKEEPLQAK